VRGNDYQHAIGWLWACKMLEDSASISSVSIEDTDGGAFDDVVVRRAIEPDLYIQAKSSNYGNKIVDRKWLTTSPTAAGKSPLQHFYRTYTDLAACNVRFSLELWTNRVFDHTNPLLALRDQKHDKIDLSQILAASPRTRIGAERDFWAAHLDITVEEVIGFLAVVRWNYTGSELEIRERAKLFMKLASLHHDEAAVDLGVTIIRGWVSDGLGPQTAADVVRQATDLGLVAARPRRTSAPEPANDRESLTAVATRGLPPGCRMSIESLREVSPEDANRVVDQLTQPFACIPGVLMHLASNPPEWLRNANPLAWDAIAQFSEAHEIPDSNVLRDSALEWGSLRGPLDLVRETAQAADDKEFERARELLEQIPETFPLFEAIAASVNDGNRGMVNAIRNSSLGDW